MKVFGAHASGGHRLLVSCLFLFPVHEAASRIISKFMMVSIYFTKRNFNVKNLLLR